MLFMQSWRVNHWIHVVWATDYCLNANSPHNSQQHQHHHHLVGSSSSSSSSKLNFWQHDFPSLSISLSPPSVLRCSLSRHTQSYTRFYWCSFAVVEYGYCFALLLLIQNGQVFYVVWGFCMVLLDVSGIYRMFCSLFLSI